MIVQVDLAVNEARRDFPGVALRKHSTKAEAKNKNFRKAGKLRYAVAPLTTQNTRAREAGFGAVPIRG